MDSARHDSCRVTAALSGHLFILCLTKNSQRNGKVSIVSVMYDLYLSVFVCFYFGMICLCSTIVLFM